MRQIFSNKQIVLLTEFRGKLQIVSDYEGIETAFHDSKELKTACIVTRENLPDIKDKSLDSLNINNVIYFKENKVEKINNIVDKMK